MANRLYEENDIQAIAIAIREKSGSANTYKVSEMASAINSIQTGDTEENRIVFTGTITETTLGSGKYAVLAKNALLAEHRSDEKLFVRAEFDLEPTPYTVTKCWGTNNVRNIPMATNVIHQYTQRYDANGVDGFGTIEYAIKDNTSPTVTVGRLYITEDGELRIYSNSANNYAIRPSNYTVVVEW